MSRFLLALSSLVFIVGCGRSIRMQISPAVPTPGPTNSPPPAPTPTISPTPFPSASPPPVGTGFSDLVSFAGVTGAVDTEIAMTWVYPANISNYGSMVFRRLPGTVPPSCNEGIVIGQVSPVLPSITAMVDHTGQPAGPVFSYRVCLFDTQGNLRSSNTVSGVHARDAAAPLALGAFTAAPGAADRTINLSLTYPTNTLDYRRIDILRLAGDTAPSPDCLSNGTLVYRNATGPFPPLASIVLPDDTQNSATTFSYRVCIFDAVGNLNANSVAVGVHPADLSPPPALTLFTGAMGNQAGGIDLNLVFPENTIDIDHVDIRRTSGSLPPGCGDGVLVKRYTSPASGIFTDLTVANVPDTLFSYRACLYDRVGNVTSQNVVLGAYKNVHYVFVTNAMYTGAMGGLAGADALCQAATQAGNALPSGLSYRAILSDSTTSAFSRVPITKGVYSAGRTLIANNSTDFWNGSHSGAIKFDQNGQDLAVLLAGQIYNLRVWTNSLYNGGVRNATNDANTCNNWTNGVNDWGRKVGYLDRSDSLWITSPDADTSDQRGHDDDHCDYPAHLYCLSR